MEKTMKKCWLEIYFKLACFSIIDISVNQLTFLGEGIVVLAIKPKSKIYNQFKKCNTIHLVINGEKYKLINEDDFVEQIELRFRKCR